MASVLRIPKICVNNRYFTNHDTFFFVIKLFPLAENFKAIA